MSTPVWKSVLAPNLGHAFMNSISCLRFRAPNFSGKFWGPFWGQFWPQMELAASATFHVEHRFLRKNTHALRSTCQEAINYQQPRVNRTH